MQWRWTRIPKHHGAPWREGGPALKHACAAPAVTLQGKYWGAPRSSRLPCPRPTHGSRRPRTPLPGPRPLHGSPRAGLEAPTRGPRPASQGRPPLRAFPLPSSFPPPPSGLRPSRPPAFLDPQILASWKKTRPVFFGRSRPLGALHGPRDRQRRAQGEQSVPGKVSGPLGADVGTITRRRISGFSPLSHEEGGRRTLRGGRGKGRGRE